MNIRHRKQQLVCNYSIKRIMPFQLLFKKVYTAFCEAIISDI